MKIIVLFILIVSATLATSCPNLQHLSTEPNNVESSKQPDNMESGTNVLPFCDSALYTILSLQYNGEELGIFELISESSEFSQCIATEEPLIALSSPATDGSVLALTYFGQVLWVDVQSKAINKVVDFPVQVEEDEEIIDVALAQDAEKVFILTSQYVLSFSLNDPTSSFTKYYFDEPLNSYSKTGISASPDGAFYIVGTLSDGYLCNGYTGEIIEMIPGSRFSFQNNDTIICSDGHSVQKYNFLEETLTCLASFNDLIFGVSVVDEENLLVWTGHNEFVGTSLGGLFFVDGQTKSVYSIAVNDHHLRSDYAMMRQRDG